MLIHRYPAGVWSVAFAPDGTLYALTRNGELWAHPADGRAKVLVARPTGDNRLEGKLDISPDGRWLSVSGYSNPTLFRIGEFEAGTRSPDRCSLLADWEEWSFPQYSLRDSAHFTGDSTFWFGVTRVGRSEIGTEYRAWKLPDLAGFEYRGVPPFRNGNVGLLPIAGTSQIVLHAWSDELKGTALWKGDLARPDVSVVEPLAVFEYDYLKGIVVNGLALGADGRFFVSMLNQVVAYSQSNQGLRRELSFSLPGFTPSPELALSADGTRFVARHFRHKIVYAGRTDTGEVGGPWDWKIGDVNDVALAPDGLTAAAAGSNKKVAVWDLE